MSVSDLGVTPMKMDPRRVRRVRFLASLLDSAFEIPGTKARIGLDPVLGLAPVAGDVLSAAASLYVVYELYRLGARGPTLAKMLANVAIDAAVGAVPVLGDLFDFAYKANTRNLRLMGLSPAPPWSGVSLGDAPAGRVGPAACV